MEGNSEFPKSSMGVAPRNSERSSSTHCTLRERLTTTRIRSSSIAPDERKHLAVVRAEDLERAAAERPVALAQRDQPFHPPQERVGVLLLGFHVDRLGVVFGVDDDGQVEPLWIGGGEAGVAVAVPLHGGADGVAVAQVDVVAHAYFVAVVDDRGARHGEQQPVHHLHQLAVVPQQRSQAGGGCRRSPGPADPVRRRGTCSPAPRRSPFRASARRDCAGTGPTGIQEGWRASPPRCPPWGTGPPGGPP